MPTEGMAPFGVHGVYETEDHTVYRNVFRDLGFRREEAEHLLVWANLMIQIQKLIASRGLKQRAAAKTLRRNATARHRSAPGTY